ncbi:MAG: hypothetical protein L0220_27220 [Acidobacteria bacterium]|nr:hypothetical protein [Acidobacteriota bacterium]
MLKKMLLVLLLTIGLTGVFWSVSARVQNRPNEITLHSNSQNTSRTFKPDEIIRQFTTKELELREVSKEYSYIQESRLQVLGPAKTISGEFYLVSEFVFNDAGKRIERIIKAPQSTLDQAGLTLTQEDKNAFINLQPFALTSEDLPNYNITFLSKEKVDELNTYVFDVTPKVMSNNKELKRLKDQGVEGRYFQGRIWVDDQDLQIVKTAGKVVPEFKQRFPKFETYRENIDGRYWFPTYTYGEDVLEFDSGRISVRMIVKYKNYRQFQSDVKLTTVDEILDDQKKPDEKEKSGTQPTKPPKKP